MSRRCCGAAEIRRARLVCSGSDSRCATCPSSPTGCPARVSMQRLLDLAARQGAEVRRGAAVRSLARTDWRRLAGHAQRRAVASLSRTVVLASGKYELRGHQRVWKPGPGCVGFKMHWRLLPEQQAALGRGIELFLYPHGYAGLQPIDAGMRQPVLRDGRHAVPDLGASFAAALAHLRQLIPTLDERLRGATPCLDDPCERRRAALRLCVSAQRLCRRSLPGRRPVRGDPFLHRRRNRDRAAHRPTGGRGDHGRRAVERFRGDGSAPGALAHARCGLGSKR